MRRMALSLSKGKIFSELEPMSVRPVVLVRRSWSAIVSEGGSLPRAKRGESCLSRRIPQDKDGPGACPVDV